MGCAPCGADEGKEVEKVERVTGIADDFGYSGVVDG